MSITNSIFCWQLCLLQAIWFLLMRTSGSLTSVGFILISVQMGAGARGHVLLLLSYHRNWLLSACAYNTWQQENMRLTGSMRLIKSTKTL